MVLRRVFVLTALAALAGCAGTASPVASPTPSHTTTPPPTKPRPTKTVFVSGPTYLAGQTAVINDTAHGVTLRLRPSPPSTSTTRRSPDHGYAPEHGHYVTFTMAVANQGRQTIQIGPLDFFVSVAGAAKTTTYDGAAPYSGENAQFDNTFLDPGESYSAPLTFDVPATHGTLAYAPDGSPAVSWRF